MLFPMNGGIYTDQKRMLLVRQVMTVIVQQHIKNVNDKLLNHELFIFLQ